MKLNDKIHGTITSIAFGGDGIMRHDGKVVFIPFACIGDVVQAEITEVKKSYARGRIVHIDIPSPKKIKPQCVHFGTCGGCQFQHTSYADQLIIKHDFVRQSLLRIGELKEFEVAPVVSAKTQWNYRKVVKLRFRLLDDCVVLGFVDYLSRDIVDILHCPIFCGDENLWRDTKAFLKTILADSSSSHGLLSLLKCRNNNFIAHIECELGKLEKTYKLPHFLDGLVVSTPSLTKTFGKVELDFSFEELNFTYTPFSFVQNHDEQSKNIYQAILNIAQEGNAKSVFDLYCGFGVTACAFANKGLRVTGVESNLESIRLAKRNASINAVTVDFICADVAAFLETTKTTKDTPDVILVNPPRIGLGDRVSHLLGKMKCPRVLYVSCMPQTLARDLKILSSYGYQIEHCQPYDMFPQTTHVETLVSLKHASARQLTS